MVYWLMLLWVELVVLPVDCFIQTGRLFHYVGCLLQVLVHPIYQSSGGVGDILESINDFAFFLIFLLSVLRFFYLLLLEHFRTLNIIFQYLFKFNN